MDMIRWRRGWQEMAICSWWHDHAASPYPNDRAWAAVPVEGAQDALGLLSHDQEALHRMRSLLAADGAFNVMRLNDRQVLDQVTHHLASRRWFLLRRAEASPSGPASIPAGRDVPVALSTPAPAALASPTAGAGRHPPPPARRPDAPVSRPATNLDVPAPAVQARAPSHWIEIELIGEDDRPIPSEAYLVELPDGSRRSGQLDGKGFARIGDLPMGGVCKVCFPELDRDAWDLAALMQESRAGGTPASAR